MKKSNRTVRKMRSAWTGFAAACLAADVQTLEEIMSQFQEDYGLDEQNFSLCYRDTAYRHW